MKWGVRKRSSRTSGSGETTVRRTRKRTVYAKSPKKLTNAELERRIKRMEMEKRYNDLNKRDVSQGEKIATEILTNVGKQAVTNVGTRLATGLLTVGAKQALKKGSVSTGSGGKMAAKLLEEFTKKPKK